MSCERLWRRQDDKDPVHGGEPWGVLFGASRVYLVLQGLSGLEVRTDKHKSPRSRGDCARMQGSGLKIRRRDGVRRVD